MTPPPQGFTLACPPRCLGTARSSFICNRYKTDRAYFAAGDTSVGFTPGIAGRPGKEGPLKAGVAGRPFPGQGSLPTGIPSDRSGTPTHRTEVTGPLASQPLAP